VASARFREDAATSCCWSQLPYASRSARLISSSAVSWARGQAYPHRFPRRGASMRSCQLISDP
jgi:hypothetical protein